MLLIHPPLAKPSEPPPGIARLSGALAGHGVRHALLDANLEGILFLLGEAAGKLRNSQNTWTRRCVHNLPRNLSAMKEMKTYRTLDRYKRAVVDVNRAIEQSCIGSGSTVSLANYQENTLSPVRSADLLRAAENPEHNPFYAYFEKRLPRIIELEQPEIIGISLTYLSQAVCAFALMGYLRRCFPDLKLVCGGGLITSWMRRPGWNNPFAGLIDHCVDGPGESALLALAGVVSGRMDDYAPDYSALPLQEYLSPGLILPYSASSGCFWNKCSFCPEHAEDNKYIPVSFQRATEELSFLTQLLNPSLLHLLDNAVSTALMQSLMISPPGAPWYGFARIGKELTDHAFCEALKKSGCVMLKLGIESGEQSVLDALSKGVDVEMASKALRSLRNAGIATYVYLLFGTPAEALPEARKTLEFTVRNADAISFLNLAIFNMPVSSAAAGECGATAFYEADLSLYTDFAHPAGWGRKQVRLFLDGEFRRNQAVSAILKKQPPYFTSNHAPFFVMS
ncbi:MAG: radical SAM domain iron-sulfur cluster-binding oxidoreductase [Nitrospirae bacterium]|nr:MAG: radical SAM domain iron-sulfur cluster-binding oxidoreductase [Nitrospirota bacterium]